MGNCIEGNRRTPAQEQVLEAIQSNKLYPSLSQQDQAFIEPSAPPP